MTHDSPPIAPVSEAATLFEQFAAHIRQMQREAEADGVFEDEATYRIGVRDGFDDAVQWLDRLTGGDGEYRFCTISDEAHCPTAVEMGQRIVERCTTPAAPADGGVYGEDWID